MRCSALRWSITGSTADLRRSSRLIFGVNPRFWPEILDCLACHSAAAGSGPYRSPRDNDQRRPDSSGAGQVDRRIVANPGHVDFVSFEEALKPAHDVPPRSRFELGALSHAQFVREFSPNAQRTQAQLWETPARSTALVRIDQKFLAGCALGVDRDVGGVERLLQRHDPGVMAGKGGFEFIDHALAQPFAVDRPDLH